MIPDEFHDFFVASGGVAGALIGLLFVALSVAPDRIAEDGEPIHRVGALAGFTAFTNALTVSLFALIPTVDLGPAVTAVAVIGLVYVASALLHLARRHALDLRRGGAGPLLGGLLVVFVLQFRSGLRMDEDRHGIVDPTTVAILVVVCFLIGISRAWALVGAPDIHLVSEVAATVRSRRRPR
jgi:hypothetical protein